MRFTLTTTEQPPATAENINPQPFAVIVQHEIDPIDVVDVIGGPHGVVLLLQGGHNMRVDGTWEIIAEKVRTGKRAARGEPAVGGIEYRPNAASTVPTEAPSPEEIEERDDVEMFTPHDGPMLVE